ncbi:O-antigen ligase family protein [Rhodococcus sp. JS3073]|uniref:O-antigen ligase family protein n=1 Tax=Rhodococcus sp. JS3073 TaxID=3002901 RepID=UPI0022860884|nr:O-antigen ligase family protein [Rhodococcus sp. JS3073]WAM16841.1 O-antigen ligase family protein [Rhodococcus sp. JS3073]
MSTTKLRPRVPLIITVALAWAAVGDIPTEISAGPMSLSGAATLIVAGGLLLLLPAVLVARSRREAPLGESDRYEPYLVGRLDHASLPVSLRFFAALALALLAVSPSVNGLQNTAVYIMFVVAVAITAASCSALTADWTVRWFRVLAIIVGSVIAGQSLIGVEVYGPRSAALMLVVFVAITLALPKSNWFDWALPVLLVVTCALTLSRTALFVSAILIPVSFLFTSRRNGILKVFAIAIPIYYVMYLLVTTWAPLRDRFLQGDAAYAVGGLTLNTSGRAVLWEMTIDSWRESPLLGKGPGSASALISSRFDHISHPHNEYLRILHDFGLIGFVPFVAGFGMLIWSVTRRALRLPQPIHKAAALALIGVAAVAITDNVLIYPFVMLPVAVLVGLSVAYPLSMQPEPAHVTRLVSA